ncbi:hypothetical protein [Bacillus cereus]|uniref:hypothetical protein n=1 Tax=Bacillus cereus TaxID=1396 RepID=UPI0005CE3835|nr:hypothetical protein [Bacillus cereus]
MKRCLVFGVSRSGYCAWLFDVKGRNYSLFAQLEERIQQALNLYSLRNIVLNPNFEQGVNDWNVTSDVKVQYIQGIPVLVLSNWNAQVNQLVPVHEDLAGNSKESGDR